MITSDGITVPNDREHVHCLLKARKYLPALASFAVNQVVGMLALMLAASNA